MPPKCSMSYNDQTFLKEAGAQVPPLQKISSYMRRRHPFHQTNEAIAKKRALEAAAAAGRARAEGSKKKGKLPAAAPMSTRGSKMVKGSAEASSSSTPVRKQEKKVKAPTPRSSGNRKESAHNLDISPVGYLAKQVQSTGKKNNKKRKVQFVDLA